MPEIQQDESSKPVTLPSQTEQPGRHDTDVAPSDRVDMEALAKCVYALLKREVAIERERAGNRPLL